MTAAAPKPPYILLRLTEKEDMNVKPLDTVRAEVHRLAMLEKTASTGAGERKIAEIRKSAKIVVNLPAYEDLASK